MTKSRLQKLRNLYRPNNENKPLTQAIAELILWQKAEAYDTLPIKAHTLQTKKCKQTYQDPNGTWIISHSLYDELHKCFNIQRLLHYGLITLPLRAKQYIPHDPLDSQYGATPYIDTAWPDTSLAIPDYTPDKLTRAPEQALYNAHAHRHTRPSSHILILPNWEHTPFFARNLHTSYVQKLTSIPYTPPNDTQNAPHKYRLNIYYVANEKALALLHPSSLNHLRDTLTQTYGITHKFTPPILNKKDASHMNSRAAYTEPYPPHPLTPPRIDTTPIRHFHTTWTPTDFIYKHGSQIKGNPTLGASVVDPRKNTTTHMEIKSQPDRHIINRAELATITTALELHRHDPSLSILTDSAFSINSLRNFSYQPHAFNHHQHKELLKLADYIIRERDLKGYTTHIGKVKPHTGVVYNDEADEGVHYVVDGKTRPDITFTEADPPIGGLRTWPQIKTIKPDKSTLINKIADMHNGIRKLLKTKLPKPQTSTITTYSNKLQHARELGADHNIHADSYTPYRARRDSLEVMS